MRSPNWQRKIPDRQPQFGEVGTRLILLDGERPVQYIGEVTGTVYVFTDLHPRRFVDLRDLPGLVKQESREVLRALDAGGKLPGAEVEEDEDFQEVNEEADHDDNDSGR